MSIATPERQAPQQTSDLSGKLYNFHGFRLIDAHGKQVGLVDWIWADENGERGEFLGVTLHWLRGTVRAIPALDVRVDRQNAIVQVPYSKDQIKGAPRYSIERAISADQKRTVWTHYAAATPHTLTQGRQYGARKTLQDLIPVRAR